MNPVRPALSAHDHALAIYDAPEHLGELLDGFVDDGNKCDQQMLFVHSFLTEEVARSFTIRSCSIAEPLLASGQLSLAHYTKVLLDAEGRIDGHHVAAQIESALRAGRAVGRTGLRIFVDASHHYLATSPEEWLVFEMWLGAALHQPVSLVCAYRSDDLAKSGHERMLHAHAFQFDPRRYPEPASVKSRLT